VDEGVVGHNARIEPGALGALRMPIVVKTVVPPFFDRFSPFSTVFPAELSRDSFGKSGVAPFSGRAAPLKNGENGENGGRSC
jgi:hypothetical protein